MTSDPTPGLPSSPVRDAINAFLVGVLAVALAVVIGAAIAYGVGYVGLTDTGFLRLGSWLAGLGLLGTWRQEVASDVAGGIGWTTFAYGVPLLVTGFVALFVAWRARRSKAWTAVPAALGAAAGGALLVAASTTQVTESNAAGSVTTTQGLTWLWDGGHLGTVTGAAILVAAVWLINTVGLRWWRSGRGVALSLLVGLGLLLTAAVVAGVVYLTSSTAVGVAVALFYPLAGTLLLFGAAGVPAEVALTRLSAQPYALSSWDQGLVYGFGGVVLVGLLAAGVGLVLRLFKHRSTWLGAVTVTAALAAFLAWAMNSAISVPDSLGTDSMVSVNVLVTAGVGAVLGAVVRFFAGRPKTDPTAATPAPAPREETDIEELLNEINGRPT